MEVEGVPATFGVSVVQSTVPCGVFLFHDLIVW